jgi:hypothetical protein
MPPLRQGRTPLLLAMTHNGNVDEALRLADGGRRLIAEVGMVMKRLKALEVYEPEVSKRLQELLRDGALKLLEAR